MGNILEACTSCCGKGSTTYEDLTPDAETRRQQQIAAAERRKEEQESRGIGNVNAVKRQQQLAAEREKQEREMGNTVPETGMKWQVN